MSIVKHAKELIKNVYENIATHSLGDWECHFMFDDCLHSLTVHSHGVMPVGFLSSEHDSDSYIVAEYFKMTIVTAANTGYVSEYTQGFVLKIDAQEEEILDAISRVFWKTLHELTLHRRSPLSDSDMKRVIKQLHNIENPPDRRQRDNDRDDDRGERNERRRRT